MNVDKLMAHRVKKELAYSWALNMGTALSSVTSVDSTALNCVTSVLFSATAVKKLSRSRQEAEL
jgi:hypothetical protein